MKQPSDSRLLALLGTGAKVRLVRPDGSEDDPQYLEPKVTLADVCMLVAKHLQDREQVPDAVAQQLALLQAGQERLTAAVTKLNELLEAPVVPVYDEHGKLVRAERKRKT